jgi:dTDP-4-dehydrorhamnose 3,5-epimerase
MRFSSTSLTGVRLIEPTPVHDARGFFARTFCVREFEAHGLEARFVQHSISHTRTRGTIRGLHFQRHPYAETKVVTCLRGAVWDVVVDLRPSSTTYCRWEAFPLTAENRCQLYIPRGFAHGFQSICDDVELCYLIADFYAPKAAAGVRYNDPTFGINWPLPPTILSERDLAWSDFVPETPAVGGNAANFS